MKSKLLFSAAVSVGLAFEAQAASFAEIGDAGEFLATAQSTTGAGVLSEITGTLIDHGSGVDDIDLYVISIFDTAAFSVTTSSTLSSDNDSQLYLFDSLGALVLSDDDGGVGLLPQFSVGELLGAPAGIYYLGFTLYNTDPIGNPLSGWDRSPAPFQTGPYSLRLTGTAAAGPSVPDGGSSALMLGAALFGLGVIRRKLR